MMSCVGDALPIGTQPILVMADSMNRKGSISMPGAWTIEILFVLCNCDDVDWLPNRCCLEINYAATDTRDWRRFNQDTAVVEHTNYWGIGTSVGGLPGLSLHLRCARD